MTLSGCDAVSGKGTVEYQPTFLPIQISLDTEGQVSIERSFGRLTPLGRIEFRPGVTRELKGVGTVIVLRHVVDGKTVEDTFELAGEGEVKVCLDGKIDESIRYDGRRTVVVITAAPGIRAIRLVDPAKVSDCVASLPPLGGGQASTTTADPPVGVARRLVQHLVSNEDAEAEALQCLNADVDNIHALLSDVAGRQEHFQSKIEVAAKNFRETVDGHQATVTASLVLTAYSVDGSETERMTQQYTFGLREEGSWKVCYARRDS